jgi:phenylalanyl-tRNA synthetase alpha chain
MAELTQNEKRLLAELATAPANIPVERLAEMLGAEEPATLQWGFLAESKGYATVSRTPTERYQLTDEGKTYALSGLPERQLLSRFGKEIPMADLQKNPLAKIGIGQMRKKGWITIQGGNVIKTGNDAPGEDELALADPDGHPDGVKDLLKRGLVQVTEEVSYTVTATPEGLSLVQAGIDLREEVGTLTRELIVGRGWEGLRLRRYNVDLPPRRVYPGKCHPYQRLLGHMREILLQMGFTEIYGGLVQSAFWNFDALFQPQDHPAREMQDTFYLSERIPVPEGYERVKEMHEHGGTTSSTGWGGRWTTDKAEQCVLRTHTTSISIQYLAAHPEPPVKAFCVNRVYRREAIDPTHLPEFEQLEGIVMDRGVTFRHLLGYLKEFYMRMGFESVRFRPGYFPYTEPSVEPEVFVDGLGWVEMGGAGIFRQEVTAPWGIEYPVLAWGLGVSRVAMLRLGLRDLRMLYRSDIEFIRETPIFSQGMI